MDVSSIDTQNAAEMSEFEGIFSAFRVLFEVADQAAVAVRASAEGGLDAPAERQRGETLDLGLACGNESEFARRLPTRKL